jgi:hypothetical protein
MGAADRYAEMLAATKVRDRPLFRAPYSPNELELQARWFAGDFGTRFVTTAGDDLDVVQFGTWNREAGPDFSDAAVRLNGSDLTRGSIEFDLADRNWETHGHATNPAFEDTVLHVFVATGEREFFSRTRAHRNVPQLRVDPSTLRESFSANVALARPGRCHAPLNSMPEERVRSVLDAGAQFRLKRKADRLRQIIQNHGRDQALFQELATALGYKENKLPFTLIAQRLPLDVLRKQRDDIEALLFGISGFLEAPDLGVYDAPTRSYVRGLWDRWWAHRDEFQRLVLTGETWKLSGARPLNHPQRRVAALALIAREWNALNRSLGKNDPETVRDFFLNLRHPFWNFHYTLTSDAADKEMALVGETRVTEIFANVLFPLFAAEGREIWTDYAKLPARLSNRRVETAATRLFADDPRRRSFMNTVAHQQGLLQIYEDFCLQDDSDCAQCPFPEQMQKWSAEA